MDYDAITLFLPPYYDFYMSEFISLFQQYKF